MIMTHFLNILKGILIGMCFPIPGVSGGTVVVLVHAYQQLIEFLSFKKEKIKEHWKLILMLGIGTAIGVFAFSNLISQLMVSHTLYLGWGFIGLIIGGLPFLVRHSGAQKFQLSYVLSFLSGAGIIVALSFIQSPINVIETTLSLTTFIKLFFASIIGAFVMIIPGASGSLILLILGQYQTIITAISDLNIVMLIPVALGCLVGILLGARFIWRIFKRFKIQANWAVIGFVSASIIVIFPGLSMNFEGLMAILICLVCAAVSFLITQIKAK